MTEDPEDSLATFLVRAVHHFAIRRATTMDPDLVVVIRCMEIPIGTTPSELKAVVQLLGSGKEAGWSYQFRAFRIMGVCTGMQGHKGWGVPGTIRSSGPRHRPSTSSNLDSRAAACYVTSTHMARKTGMEPDISTTWKAGPQAQSKRILRSSRAQQTRPSDMEGWMVVGGCGAARTKGKEEGAQGGVGLAPMFSHLSAGRWDRDGVTTVRGVPLGSPGLPIDLAAQARDGRREARRGTRGVQMLPSPK